MQNIEYHTFAVVGPAAVAPGFRLSGPSTVSFVTEGTHAVFELRHLSARSLAPDRHRHRATDPRCAAAGYLRVDAGPPARFDVVRADRVRALDSIARPNTAD